MKRCPKCREKKRIVATGERSTFKQKIFSLAGGRTLLCQVCGTEYTYFGRMPIVPDSSFSKGNGEPIEPGEDSLEYAELVRRIEQEELDSGLLKRAEEDGESLEPDEEKAGPILETPDEAEAEPVSAAADSPELEIEAIELSPETDEKTAGQVEVEPSLEGHRVEDQEEVIEPSLEGHRVEQQEDVVDRESPRSVVEELSVSTSQLDTSPPPSEKSELPEESAPTEQPGQPERTELREEEALLQKKATRPHKLKNYDSLSLFPRRRGPERKDLESE
ncbi:MAG: hypothetical protein JSU96_03595 [Acidobacteriota bacterium]|nr:MAG: hypothetical protein JSU96_03595 [Acidobacteriota bacterium]